MTRPVWTMQVPRGSSDSRTVAARGTGSRGVVPGAADDEPQEIAGADAGGVLTHRDVDCRDLPRMQGLGCHEGVHGVLGGAERRVQGAERHALPAGRDHVAAEPERVFEDRLDLTAERPEADEPVDVVASLYFYMQRCCWGTWPESCPCRRGEPT